MKPSLSPRAAATAAVSCVAVLATTGCVSQKQFSQACHERDQVAAALATTRDDRARLTTELTQTWADRDSAWQDAQDLSTTLQAALDHSAAIENRSNQTQASLEQTQTSLTTAQLQLNTAHKNLTELQRASATAREQLAAANKRGDQLDSALRAAQAAFAQFKTQAKAQADEIASRLKQVQLDLVEAQKDQAALVSTREKLAESQRSDADARKRLADSQESAAALATNLKSASEQVIQLKNEAHTHEMQSVAARIAQADIAAANLHKVQSELETLKTKQAQAERTATDAKARLASAEKRAADLEAQVKVLTAQARRTKTEEGDKTATAAANPGPAKTASAKTPPSETASVRSGD